LADIAGTSKNKTENFIGELASSSLRRRGQIPTSEVEAAINQIEQGGLNQNQAEEYANLIQKFQDRNGGQSPLSTDATAAQQKVANALTRLGEYDTLVASIYNGTSRARSISDFATQLQRIDRLPQLFTILSQLPSPDIIRGEIISKVEVVAQAECQKNEKVSRLTDYGMHANNLGRLKTDLGRLNLSGLVVRVDEALTRLDEAKEHLEAQQREQQDVTAIKQIQTNNVGLAQLLEHQTRLDGLSGSGMESVREAARGKLEQVRQKIKDLRNFSVSLPGKIDALRDAKTARSLGDEVLRKRGLYEGTADLKDLDADRERIAELEAYFTELERHANYRTREEVNGRQAQLVKLRQDFAAGGALHDSQAELVEQELEKLAAFVRQQETEAKAWLNGISSDLAAGRNLRALRNQLASSHAFLPEELQPQLTTLADQVDVALAGEAQESQRVEAIMHLPANGTVVQLRETLRKLERYENDTERVRGAADKKRGGIEAELRHLTKQVSQWQDELARVTRLKDVNRLAGSVQTAESLYQGSDLEEKVVSLISQLETVEQMIQELETPFAATSFTAIEHRRQHLNNQRLLTGRLQNPVREPLESRLSKQRQVLDERVAYEEAQLAEILARLATARNTYDVQRLDARLSSAQTFFADSERAAVAAEAHQRSVTLKQYFSDLDRTESAPAGTPADLSAQQRSVEEVYNRYKEHLQDAQRSVALLQLDKISDILKRKQEEARAWLGRQQERLARAHTAGELNQLERDLQSTPTFLPEELQSEHAGMRKQVAAKLDGLQLEAIEDRFKKLDRAKRAACLQRLERIMRELEAV
jgi:hypothetical protein